MNAEQTFDSIITGVQILSDMCRVRDLLAEWRLADKKKCGNCEHWMKASQCPKETDVKGRPHGPSMNDAVCSQFKVTSEARQLKEQRRHNIMRYCKEKGLPLPAALGQPSLRDLRLIKRTDP